MIGIGAAELGVLLLLATGGLGAPLVGVPLAPDATLQRAAPAECLFYVGTGGTAAADPKSKNQIEQLMAEPEVADFVGELTRLSEEALKRLPAGNEKEKMLARTLPVVATTLLSRPAMLYLAKVDLPPQPPSGNAALVVNAGDSTAAFVEALEELEKLYVAELPPNMAVEPREVGEAKLRKLPTPPGAPPVSWGVRGTYVFLAVGDGEAEALVERLSGQGETPAWLARLHADLDIPRVSAAAYLHLAGVLKTVDPLIDQFGGQLPISPRKVIDALGLDHLEYVALGSGLNETVSVSKVVVAHDGEAEGLLDLLDAEPLTTDDLAGIPQSADVAVVGRLDLGAVFDAGLKIAGEIEPRAADQARAALDEMQRQLGLSLRDDLLAGLGDTWTVYNSADDGGAIFTGLCATIGVRDRAKLEKILGLALRVAEAQRNDERPEFAVRSSKVGDDVIHYVQFLREPVPFAPAWCLTDEELIVAITPQMVRAHLTRPDDAPSLADVPEVAAALKSGDVTSLTYSDVRFGLQLLYSYASLGVTMGAAALEKETGVRADLAKFPSFAAISRHLRPTIGVTRRTKKTWTAETYATGPSIGPGTVAGAGVVAALVLPAVQQARAVARETTAKNSLRQLYLGFVTHADAVQGGWYPQNIRDENGKPLLSWRVAVLPYVDQQALYERFRLDEPWDSAHNRPLIAAMPGVFAHAHYPQVNAEGKTLMQIPTGKGAMYTGKNRPGRQDVDVHEIPSTQLACLVLTKPEFAVEWTKPDDVALDVENPTAKLLVERGGGFTTLRYDGSVQMLAPPFDPDMLRQMFFPNLKD